jgi:hypothetical protein
MANTPPSAHQSQPLQGILNSLNNPGVCDCNDNKAVDENVTFFDLANIDSSNSRNNDDALLNSANYKKFLLTRASINNNAQQHESTEGASVGSKVTQQAHANLLTKKAKGKESDENFSSSSSSDEDCSDDNDNTINEMVEPKKPAPTTKTPRAKNNKVPAAPNKKKSRRKRITKSKKKTALTPTTTAAAMPTTMPTAPESDKASPSLETVPRIHVNALKMLEDGVFDEGYDSDGHIGPPRGTDEEEIDALKEDALVHNAPPPAETVAEDDQDDDKEPEPVHVPMTEEEIKALTIPLLKEELRLRRVPFKASLKKDGLVDKLREALSQKTPKHIQEQLDAAGTGTKKKKEDDMTAFKVGAWWKELKPMDEQVDEPANEQFPEARAPTIPEEQRQVPLQPKYNYAEKWDRPPFQGSAHHGRERLNGRANDAFLKAHNLDQHSSPASRVCRGLHSHVQGQDSTEAQPQEGSSH